MDQFLFKSSSAAEKERKCVILREEGYCQVSEKVFMHFLSFAEKLKAIHCLIQLVTA